MSFRRFVLTDEFECLTVFMFTCVSLFLRTFTGQYTVPGWVVKLPEEGTRKSSKKSNTTSHLLQLSQESA